MAKHRTYFNQPGRPKYLLHARCHRPRKATVTNKSAQKRAPNKSPLYKPMYTSSHIHIPPTAADNTGEAQKRSRSRDIYISSAGYRTKDLSARANLKFTLSLAEGLQEKKRKIYVTESRRLCAAEPSPCTRYKR